MSKEQTTTKAKLDGNLVFDRLLQVAAGLTILTLAFYQTLHMVKATQPVNYILATGFIGFLIYTLVAPQFRRR